MVAEFEAVLIRLRTREGFERGPRQKAICAASSQG